MTRPGITSLALVFLTGCVSGLSGHRTMSPGDSGHPVSRVIGPSGTDVTWSVMLDALALADVVFVGETHLDERTHDAELAILEGVIERRGGKTVLAMEMFETDVQQHLDDYLAGRIDEATMLSAARPWSNYQTGYRSLLETAKRHRVPVVAANFPRPLRGDVSRGGTEALEELSVEHRALLPERFLPNSVAYWERFDRAVSGHMGTADRAIDPEGMVYSVQSLWDNAMGWSVAQALDRHPGRSVLHVCGGFHTKYGEGTAHQLRLRKPDATIATVQIRVAGDLDEIDLRDAGRAADYLLFVRPRGRGVQEGFHGVSTSRDLRFRVHVPDDATDAQPAALLIWLPREGLRARDAEAYWRVALGDEVMIVTLEPPYMQRETDLHLGGRWYWTETFHDDVGAAIGGVEDVYHYLMKHFPVDARRTMIAGAGTGATVVALTALSSDRLPVEMLAVMPTKTAKLVEWGLPDLPTTSRRLEVMATSETMEQWTSRCAGYRSVGLDATAIARGPDPWRETEARVRDALGLGAVSPEGAAKTPPTGGSTGLAAYWARLLDRRLRATHDVPPVDADGPKLVFAFAGEPLADDDDAIAYGAADFADARTLPRPPGPFGGTTLVIVPAAAPASERAAWQLIADSDAMSEAHGRFYRLRIAFESGPPTLRETLDRLESSGRKNVLIVPALFCADAETMRGYERIAADHADRMTITWLPGLGGSLVGPAVR